METQNSTQKIIQVGDILKNATLPQTLFRRARVPKESWTMETVFEAAETVGTRYEPRFQFDKDNKELFENLAYWLMCDNRMTAIDPNTGQPMPGRLSKGIYIAGNTGSGKTVAMRILRKLYDFNPYYFERGSRYSWDEARADEITTIYAKEGDLERFKRAPLLCIQDLGSEPSETLYMGNRANVLRQVLEYRGDNRALVTMVTSNIPMSHKDLTARYGERATSRIKEMMNYLELKGPDRRLKL